MAHRAAAVLLGLAVLLPTAAFAQKATVYCVNNKIRVERASMSQMQSGRGHSEICIAGPSFDFQPDGVRWAQQHLGGGDGGNCSCR